VYLNYATVAVLGQRDAVIGDLCITSVSSCIGRGFKARANFRLTSCWCWRVLAPDGSSGAFRGDASAPIGQVLDGAAPPHGRHVAGDGLPTVRAGSGLALGSDRSVRSGLQGQARLRMYIDQRPSICAGWPASTVAPGTGRADTYTQQAIPRI
jgi:hypothetical protein